MVQKHDKMKRSHQKARKVLEDNGFRDIWIIHHTRWQKDIYGLWDGVAFLDNEIFFIQVKSNSFPSPIKIWEDFCVEHDVRGILINIKDGGGVEVKTLPSMKAMNLRISL